MTYQPHVQPQVASAAPNNKLISLPCPGLVSRCSPLADWCGPRDALGRGLRLFLTAIINRRLARHIPQQLAFAFT